jgi:hypothetical protein
LLGKRPTSPTVPMILADRIGPMPKISVRVVPEASTSASIRRFRSAIFLSRVRTSRKISDANRRRRRAEAPLGRMPRRIRAARSAESVLATPPGTRPRRSAWRRLSALVRSATRSSLLSESKRSASDAASGSTAASHSLREAAKAVARASTPSFLRALPAKLESTRTRAETESLGGTSTTHSPEAASLSARSLPRARRQSPPLRAALGEPSRPSFEGPQAFSRFCRKLARSRSSLVASSIAATAKTRRFVGIDPY